MVARRLTDEDHKATVKLIEDCLKDGFTPPDSPRAGMSAINEAARRFSEERGCAPQTFRTRLSKAREAGHEPDWSIWRPPVYQRKKTSRAAPVDNFDNIHPLVMEPEGEPEIVLAIGDTHDDPRIPDKERFKWMGRCAADLGVDRIVQIGDFGTWDSVSRHEDRTTIRGRALPSYEDDLASCRMALMALNQGLDGYHCKKDITLGNHEDRVKTYENLHPQIEGSLYLRLRQSFADYGWRTSEYGEYRFIKGVGFTHVPHNIMGRPYGGKTLNPMGNDAVFSIVFGHSHKGAYLNVPKIGPNCSIDILNLGCALPHGHVEDYAKLSTTGWTYGVYKLRLQAGRILSHEHISMIDLRERYGE